MSGKKGAKPAWMTAANRTREGKRHYFECLKEEGKTAEYWFIPVKFCVEGAEAIRQIYISMNDGMSPELAQKLTAGAEEKKTGTEIIKELSPGEMAEYMSRIDLQKLAGADMKRMKLKYGFGKNNLFEENTLGAAGPRGELDEEFLDQLMIYAEMVDEALRVIRELNGPLG